MHYLDARGPYLTAALKTSQIDAQHWLDSNLWHVIHTNYSDWDGSDNREFRAEGQQKDISDEGNYDGRDRGGAGGCEPLRG